MMSALAGVSLGIGALGAAVSYLLPALSGRPRAERPRVLPALTLGVVLVLALFLLTRPTAPPFSPGQRLGLGFLIGGVFGLIAAAGCAVLARRDESYWPYPGMFAFSLAVAAVSVALLMFGGDPEGALLGCALGFGLVAGILRLGLADVLLPMEAGAVLTATLAAASLLAVHHFPAPTQRDWWLYPLALAAAWVLAQAVAYAVAARPSISQRYAPLLLTITALLAAIITLFVGGMLEKRLGPQEGLGVLLLTGFVTAALLVWVTTAVAADEAPSHARHRAAALALILMLFVLVLSFKLLQAFGAAVTLVAVWAIVAPVLALGDTRSWRPVQVLTVGANFLLLRLFLEGIGAAPGDVQPDLHYTLVGLLLGVLLPGIFLSCYERPGLGRPLFVGLLTALSPLVLVTLWGPDAAVGFLLGLIAAPAVAAIVSPGPDSWIAPAGLVSLGLAVVTVQFSGPFADLYQLPRLYKVYLAGGIAVLVVVGIAGLGVARLLASRQPSQEG